MLAIPVRQRLLVAGLQEHAADTEDFLHETLLFGDGSPSMNSRLFVSSEDGEGKQNGSASRGQLRQARTSAGCGSRSPVQRATAAFRWAGATIPPSLTALHGSLPTVPSPRGFASARSAA